MKVVDEKNLHQNKGFWERNSEIFYVSGLFLLVLATASIFNQSDTTSEAASNSDFPLLSQDVLGDYASENKYFADANNLNVPEGWVAYDCTQEDETHIVVLPEDETAVDCSQHEDAVVVTSSNVVTNPSCPEDQADPDNNGNRDISCEVHSAGEHTLRHSQWTNANGHLVDSYQLTSADGTKQIAAHTMAPSDEPAPELIEVAEFIALSTSF